MSLNKHMTQINIKNNSNLINTIIIKNGYAKK